jgi:cytochrome b561
VHDRGGLVHVPWRIELTASGDHCSVTGPTPHSRSTMTESHYTRTAVTLHWAIAGLIFAGLFMGWTMTDMAISPQRLKVYNYHKWVGITVLALALVRLVWKLTHAAPALLPMPRWQQLAARIGHGLLYALMIAVPMAGWIYSNATGYRVVYLGRLPLPNLVEKDRELAAAWVQVHGNLAMILAVLIGLHVLAALHHQFVVRDNTLRRMLRWRA